MSFVRANSTRPTVPDAPIITRVQPKRPRGLKVLVHLDDGSEPFEVMLEALERNQLGLGDTLPPPRRRRLLDDDADVRVRDAALNLLSYRARTRTELRRKLRTKGFEPHRIARCLDRLEEKGFLDDAAVAAAFIRDRLRHRPKGHSALRSELRAKGVDPELAGATIEQVFDAEGTSDEAIARACAEQWVRRQGAELLIAFASDEWSEEKQKARRRLTSWLGRRGFRGGVLGGAIDHAIRTIRSAEHT